MKQQIFENIKSSEKKQQMNKAIENEQVNKFAVAQTHHNRDDSFWIDLIFINKLPSQNNYHFLSFYHRNVNGLLD